MGSGYVMEHVLTAFCVIREEEIYRQYVTDGMYVISDSIAHIAGGKSLQVRYEELIHPKDEDNRTEEDIINAIEQKLKAMEK